MFSASRDQISFASRTYMPAHRAKSASVAGPKALRYLTSSSLSASSVHILPVRDPSVSTNKGRLVSPIRSRTYDISCRDCAKKKAYWQGCASDLDRSAERLARTTTRQTL